MLAKIKEGFLLGIGIGLAIMVLEVVAAVLTTAAVLVLSLV